MRPSTLIARSQPMRRLVEEVRRFAIIDANVLISGETGVGKSVIALALHAGGRRRRRPFVTIDCRSLPTTLIEAELFGVERGAFTGATRDKPGKFEAAGTGTIYLDGVDELPLTRRVSCYGSSRRNGSNGSVRWSRSSCKPVWWPRPGPILSRPCETACCAATCIIDSGCSRSSCPRSETAVPISSHWPECSFATPRRASGARRRG